MKEQIRKEMILKYQNHETPEEFQDLVREEKHLIFLKLITRPITLEEIYKKHKQTQNPE